MSDDEDETVIGGDAVPTPTQAQAGAAAAGSAGAPDDGEDDDGQEPHAQLQAEPHADGPTSPPRRDPRE